MKLLGKFKKRFHPIKIILGLIFLYLLVVFWPIKGLLLPSNWWGKTLIVFMNDSEARPCGGFVTAFGVLDLPKFKLELKNAYHFAEVDYGVAKAPLDQVSARLKFWDLGYDYNLQSCSESFGEAYFEAEDKAVDRTILVQASFLEDWIKVLGSLKLDGEKIEAKTFFPLVSRSVADVDRHNESALETRKQPLVFLGKQLMRKTFLNPFEWAKFTHLLRGALDENSVFWSGYSRFKIDEESENHKVSVAEWNLGGGKSSRVLRKSWSVDLREVLPDKWEAKIRIEATHLGQKNEPLSQDWIGGFEVSFYKNTKFISATIAPGETFVKEIILPLENTEKTYLFTPAYQYWETDFSASFFPEQVAETSVSHFRGFLPAEGKFFEWKSDLIPDEKPPFLVIHKPIPSNQVSSKNLELLNFDSGDLVVELRFNESIEVRDFKAVLSDKNIENKVTSDLAYKSHLALGDQQTILVNFAQNPPQVDERFELQVSGVKDFWGNEAAIEGRTVITR